MRTVSVRTLVATALLIWIGCVTERVPAVASVGDENISLEVFADRYKDFLQTAGVGDNLHFRHQFMNSLIDELLILRYADDLDISNDPHISIELDRLQKQLLLNRVYEREIQSKIVPSERDLLRLFDWSKTSFHVRHLFSRSRGGIDAISARLAAGEKWETLAEEVFRDPVLAQNGGDLGFVSLSDLDPAFEQIAFRLRDGEISTPVATRSGYSIIQVLEREVEIFRTESEFASQRDRLEQVAKSHNKRPKVREYTDEIVQGLGLKFHDQGLREIFRAMEERDTKFPESFLPHSHLPCITVEQDRKTFTAADTWLELDGLSLTQRSRIETIHQLKESLTGLMVRKELLARSKDLGIDNDPQFLRDWSRARNNYLVTAILKRLPGSSDEHDRLPKADYHQFIQSLRSNAPIEVDSLSLKRWLGPEEIVL